MYIYTKVKSILDDNGNPEERKMKKISFKIIFNQLYL